MVTTIQLQNQKVRRRKPQRPSRSRKTAEPAGFGKKSGLGTGLGEGLSLYRLKRTIKGWIKNRGRLRKLSWFTAAGVGLLLAGLFFTSTVPTSGASLGRGGLSLPEDAETSEALLAYLRFDEPPEEAETTAPEGSILDATSPDLYTLVPGDTLSEIADSYGVSLGTLISYNGIRDVRRIQAGSVVRIPRVSGVLYRVRRGDNLSSIAERHNVPLNDILDANDLESSIIRSGQELFIPGASLSSFEIRKATGELFRYPAIGRLSSPYGMRNDPFTGVRRMHYGIDIAGGVGTPITSAMDGQVLAVGFSLRSYGKYVIMKHQGGYQTLYGHLETVEVSEGQRVRQGQKIGTMGNTGRSTGPHLHFGIYQFQNPIDPAKYLY
jgi:murein DD-endopeptidase MepM/ murein hydrolase activator NlpD